MSKPEITERRKPVASHGGHPCGACPVRNLSVCSALNDDELAVLEEIVSNRDIPAHQMIFQEGDDAGDLFNVLEGVVTLYKLMPDGRRQITGFLFNGDFMGLSVNGKFAYSAESVTPVTMCRFPRRRLDGLMERFPHLQRRMMGLASNELAAAQDQMLLLGRKSAKEKIASFLLTLSRRAAQREQPDDPVFLPMSRADIGDFLGLTTETVSRTFTHLKSSGVIRLLEGHRVHLADREALTDIAEGL
ncbi:MAG: helix-turn-helix domain-containing protein [Azospirillaceae bacterium]